MTTTTTCKSSEMCLIFFLLFTNVKAMEIETPIRENINNNNGWTPINRDKVYNSLPETLYPGTNIKETLEQNLNQMTHIQRNYRKQKFANIEEPIIYFQPPYVNFKDNIASSRMLSNLFTDSKVETVEENNLKLNTNKNRKAKAILSNATEVVNKLTKPEQITELRDFNHANELERVQQGKPYQVTENQEQKEDLEKLYRDVIKPLDNESSNNHYDVINGTVRDDSVSNTNEFTNKFLGILSSYNIRVNDVLPNYELSRHLNRNPSTREYIMVPIPLRFANRLNSLNPVPFDPLLAVFLSNFGYYLPGHYGINNKYYNLYGYLASNNMHNNEPFGSYKIFADTDSSN